jgi:transcriptional regulator with XRE-family HTH domain
MASLDPVTKEVVRRLIAFREQLRLTQGQLANLSGVSRTTIANIEGERQGVPLPLLYKLCKGLQVDPVSILPSPDEVPDAESSTLALGGVTRELPVGVVTAMSSVLNRKSRRSE